jgi:hypothetical protein
MQYLIKLFSDSYFAHGVFRTNITVNSCLFSNNYFGKNQVFKHYLDKLRTSTICIGTTATELRGRMIN